MLEPVLKVRNLSKVFPLQGKGFFQRPAALYAVNDVSFDLFENEVVGLVGESGCGKSTLGRLVLRLVEASAGSVEYLGRNLGLLSPEELRKARSGMQMIFQDPNGSLNPSMTIGQTIEETQRFHKIGTLSQRRENALEMLRTVGLQAEHFNRFPHQMSGGQNQRASIARALVINPKLLVLDEPVSALDVSVQAQVLKLLEDIRSEYSLSSLFISHDLSVVRRVSDRIVVLYLGHIVEIATSDSLFEHAAHPYTKGLLASRPSIDPKHRAKTLTGLRGELPSPMQRPAGCPFVSRCPIAFDRCRTEIPRLKQLSDTQSAACFAN